MALYDFITKTTQIPKKSFPTPGIETKPNILVRPPAISQTSDIEPRLPILEPELGVEPEYVEEYTMKGFRSLDSSMKTYWSGIKIPTKNESFRCARVKISGGDKSTLVWHDELNDGRVILPAISIERTSYTYNPDKYSPPYLPMVKRHLSRAYDKVAKVFRPVPYLVDYTLTIWSNYKSDMDVVLYSCLTRFNGSLAEFVHDDDHIRGTVQIRLNSASDVSEKASYDKKNYRKTQINMTCEAWLPLPEVIVPTVLGTVSSIREESTNETYGTTIGDLVGY